MFNEKDYYNRLTAWKNFRKELDQSEDPFAVIREFYGKAPLIPMAVDPYNKELWPDPWEQVEENLYCPFTIVLAAYYALMLSNRFNDSRFEIHIGTDEKKEQVVYCLLIDEQVFGFWDDSDAPNGIIPRHRHVMPPAQ